jgi:thiamine pyrophosphate-dependent acetolactate synthase large subunit-like protein
MHFHEAMARCLADHGITHVFGVLGDANLYMMDSFERVAQGRYLSFSNEAGAVLAANGYARVSGGLGVATVTHGPALSNTVTALVESVKEHTPLLLLAGDTALADRDNFQAIPQREIAISSGAGFEQVRTTSSYPEDVATAVRRAHLERRPVVLNVPVDFQWEQVEYQRVPSRFVSPQAVRPDLEALGNAAGVIASARRPIVLAGRGATSHEARAGLIRLAERIGAPLATSLRGKDLFRGHPHNLGVVGTLANEVGMDTVNQADCIVAFGAGLNKWTTADGWLLDNKRVVHVDIDPDAINRWGISTVGVVGDSAVTADALVEMLDEADTKPTDFASEDLAVRLRALEASVHVDRSTATTVDLLTAVRRIDESFPAERTLVYDGGRWTPNCFTTIHVPEPNAYVHTVNYGSIGLGMGNAIGAAAARPDRPVLLVVGDGGFMMGGLAEFNTAVRHGLDIVVVLLNDGAYGAEYIQFRDKGLDPKISTFSWPDFGPVATALGGDGYTVRNTEELETALAAISRRSKPILIDIKLDPDTIPSIGH